METQAEKHFTGIILSGGKSRRMGKEKGLCHFRGKALIAYAIETLQPLCDELIISANNKLDEYQLLDFPVVSDEMAETGPIGGLFSCLNKSKNAINLVISCDTPFVTQEVYHELLKYIGDYQAVVPIHENGFVEPLTAVYHRSCLPEVQRQLLAGKYKMMDLLDRINTKYVPVNSQIPGLKTSIFHNLNNPEDLLSC